MAMSITFDGSEAVGVMTLTGDSGNTMVSPAFADTRTLEQFLNAPNRTAVIIRGESRHFCAGADLESVRQLARDPTRLAQELATGKELLDLIRFAPVPVVAAVRGSCLGSGLELALACHFRVAAASALLGFPESSHGLIPGLGGTCERSVGRGEVTRLVLSGAIVRADEALGLGLVDRLCAPSKLEYEARALLEPLIARRTPQVIHAAMISIANATRLPRREALLAESRLFCELAASAPPEDE